VKTIKVHRNVETPMFPGLKLDSFSFDGHTTYASKTEASKLLNEYGYQFVCCYIDDEGRLTEKWVQR
jgi:hypothetical protein